MTCAAAHNITHSVSPGRMPCTAQRKHVTAVRARGVGRETQTNTGRFSSLVDFDHAGMNDKVFIAVPCR
jgi:hypothetical protein